MISKARLNEIRRLGDDELRTHDDQDQAVDDLLGVVDQLTAVITAVANQIEAGRAIDPQALRAALPR